MDHKTLVKRSISLRQAREIVEGLERLGTLDLEFDGILRRYNDEGEFIGTYWMDTEGEEWMYDPMGEE